MTYGYIRVSTEKQTVKNQRYEIEQYCKTNKIKKYELIEETVSGMKDPKKRKLYELTEQLENGDLLIVSEVSRIGRRMDILFNTFYELENRGVKIYSIKQNHLYENNLDELLIYIIEAWAAAKEREHTVKRTVQALKERRSEGIVLGRQKGFKPSHWKLTPKAKYISRQIGLGKSMNSIAHELGVEWYTLNTYVKQHLKNDLRRCQK